MNFKPISILAFCALIGIFPSCQTSTQQDENTATNATEQFVVEDKAPWKVGVLAYTFRHFTFFEAVDKAKALGLSYIGGYAGQEIGGGIDGKMGIDLDADTQKKISDYLDSKGVKLIDFGVITPKNDEDWRKLFVFAKAMGIPTIVSEPHPNDLAKVVALGDEFDINIAIHNHPSPSLYAHPDTMLQVIQQHSKRLGVCADVGHWIRSGFDPVESLRKMEGRLLELHFKDESVKGKEAVEIVWGTGVANVKGMLEELKRQNFSGVLAVEYESKPEDNFGEIQESLQYYNSVIKAW